MSRLGRPNRNPSQAAQRTGPWYTLGQVFPALCAWADLSGGRFSAVAPAALTSWAQSLLDLGHTREALACALEAGTPGEPKAALLRRLGPPPKRHRRGKSGATVVPGAGHLAPTLPELL